MEDLRSKLTYDAWDMRYNRHKVADETVVPFLQAPNVQPRNQLKSARLALHLTLENIAKNLKLSPHHVSRFESNEVRGTITLNSLRKCAEAMDCELIYVIRPKSRLTFSQTIWKIVYPIVHASRVADGQLEGTFALWANVLMENPEFRYLMQWNKRAAVSSGGAWRMFDNFKAQEILKRISVRGCG